MPTYEAKNYDHLIGTQGFSEQLLKNHFTLYQGYVTNTNRVIDELAQLVNDDKANTPSYAEMKRRFGWEFNGVRLHELYFGNMTKDNKQFDSGSALANQINTDFGSYDNWMKDFKGTGAMRGIGWAAVYWEPGAKRLFNTWIQEHDAGHLAGCQIVMIMDVFEHAFMIDYGLRRADYIESFFNAIDWEVTNSRFDRRLQEYNF